MNECVLPGCNVPVAEVGDACADCVTAFGTWLRPSGRPALTAQQIHDRDAYVARAYYAQRRLR